MKVTGRASALLIAFALAACGETQAGDNRPAGETRNATAEAPSAPPRPRVARVAGESILKLAAPADEAAIDSARLAAAEAGVTDVTITRVQSFRVMNGATQVATLVAGEGQAPDATFPGCFLALVQDGKVRVVPTISSGNWEMVTCDKVEAIALLDRGDTLRFGAIYSASSHSGAGTEPVVLDWDRAGADLTINEPLSVKASLAGAGTIAKLRAALR